LFQIGQPEIKTTKGKERDKMYSIKQNPTTRWGMIGAIVCLLAISGVPDLKAAPKPNLVTIPNITSIVVSNGQLLANGTVTAILHGKTNTVPFTAPVTIALATNQVPAPGACPVLDLTLGPIDLDLLGLIVQTSPICLTITANAGGGLLGDLLCSVANLLNGGLNLSQILSGQGIGGLPGLTALQLNSLLGGIEDLLNAALGNLLNSIVTQIIDAVAGSCDILHLALGPLDLTLLGLEVVLDDCNGGPVVVDISGQRGNGNLLGNLLCGLLGSGRIGLGSTLGEILSVLPPGR
jgi:hypothetical protein